MRRSSWTGYLSSVAVLLTATRADAIVNVTTCDQLVPRGETAVLQNDLSCDSQYGIQLDTGATLDLQDHTLSFQFNPAWPSAAAVYCATAGEKKHSSCRVIGTPGGTGAVVGDGDVRFGIFGDKVEVQNVSVAAFGDWGIYGDKRAILVDVAIADVDGCAIKSERKVAAERLSVAGRGDGICAGKRVTGIDLAVNGQSGVGIRASSSVRIDGLSSSGNAVGIESRGVRLERSLLSGNALDIASGRSPRLETSVCETSRKLVDGSITAATWGVCSAD